MRLWPLIDMELHRETMILIKDSLSGEVSVLKRAEKYGDGGEMGA